MEAVCVGAVDVLGMSPAVDCCSTMGRSHHMLERNEWKSSTLSVLVDPSGPVEEWRG